MGLKLKNNAASNLAASLSDTETLIRVLAGHGARFPTLNDGDWFPLAVQNVMGEIEYMRANARAGDVITVQRGQESTQARKFEAGDVVFLPLTVAALNTLGGGSGGAGQVYISISDAQVTG